MPQFLMKPLSLFFGGRHYLPNPCKASASSFSGANSGQWSHKWYIVVSLVVPISQMSFHISCPYSRQFSIIYSLFVPLWQPQSQAFKDSPVVYSNGQRARLFLLIPSRLLEIQPIGYFAKFQNWTIVHRYLNRLGSSSSIEALSLDTFS